MRFGAKIKQLRQSKGLRPEHVASEVDVCLAVILRYENLPAAPTALLRFKRLAETLDITLDELATLGAETLEEVGA